MELFEFKGEDLTEEEDGGIIRRIQTQGEGFAKPNDGALVEGETVVRGFSLNSVSGWLWASHFLSLTLLSSL